MTDYPEAVVNLIDALRAYLEIERGLYQDALRGEFGDLPQTVLDSAKADIDDWARKLVTLENHNLEIWSAKR